MSLLSPEFRLVKKADAARIFDVCVKTIDNYIAAGLLPPPAPFGSKEYWHPDEFEGFLARTFKRHLASAPHGQEVTDAEEARSAQAMPASQPDSAQESRKPARASHPAARARARCYVPRSFGLSVPGYSRLN